MTVLITGATGFLGSRCVRQLAMANHVVATGRDQTALDDLATISNVTAVRADLTDPTCVDELAAHRPTAIVHAAALSSLWGHAEHFFAANVIGTRHVLDMAGRCDAKLVHISTPTIYMDGTDRPNLDESSRLPTQGVNAYAETKRQAEDEVRGRDGVSSIILRPQGIVGAGDTAVAPRFLRAMDRGFFPLIDGGQALSELTHVANVVQAIELALRFERPAAPRAFNLTNGEPMSTRDLLDLFLAVRHQFEPDSRPVRYVGVSARIADHIASTLERASRLTGNWEPMLTGYSVQVLSRDRTFDIGAARSELGYDPSAHTIRDAFTDFFTHRAGP